MAKKATKAKAAPAAVYDLLTPSQKSVVDHQSGPLLAGAVAGAGKSTTLIERVARLVSAGVPIQRICLVAFNVAAAEDLNKKLKKRLKGSGLETSEIEVARTLHSLALAVFKSDPSNRHVRLDHTGSWWPKAIQASLETHQIQVKDVEVVKKFASKVRNDYLACDPMLLRLGHLPPELVKAAHEAIASRKMAGITDPRLLIEVFVSATNMRQTEGVQGSDGPFVSFDDVLWEAVRALERDDDLLAIWQGRFDHIIVDEAQDLCESQWLMVELLSRKHTNIVVVGDPAQALYRFRGARPQRLTGFAARWPGCASVYMQENFRSGSDILRSANNVLDAIPLGSRLPMQLASTRGVTGTVSVIRASEPSAEATQVAALCIERRNRGLEWRDMAILVRMNDQTMDLELRLFAARVPTRIVSGASFFTTHETKVMLSYLRLIFGQATSDDLLLAVTNPGRYLGKKFVEEVGAKCGAEPGDWVEKVARSGAGRDRGRDFCAQMLAWRSSMKRGSTPRQLIDFIIEKTDYERWHMREKQPDDATSNLPANLRRVGEFAAEFDTVEGLLGTVDEMRASQKAAALSRNAVTISTVHQSKGLEWPVVFVPGVTAERWPVPWGDIEDELRCFYVALTRAKDECIVSSYDSLTALDGSEAKASRFLGMVVPSAAQPAPAPLAASQLSLV